MLHENEDQMRLLDLGNLVWKTEKSNNHVDEPHSGRWELRIQNCLNIHPLVRSAEQVGNRWFELGTAVAGAGQLYEKRSAVTRARPLRARANEVRDNATQSTCGILLKKTSKVR